MYSRETDAAVAELADAQDSKSCDSNIVSVRPRSAALKQSYVIAFFIFCILYIKLKKMVMCPTLSMTHYHFYDYSNLLKTIFYLFQKTI